MKKIYLFLFIVLSSAFSSYSYGQIASLEATLSLKNIDGANVPYQSGMPVPNFMKQERQIISLAGVWKKQRTGVSNDISLAKRDDAGMSALIAECSNRFSGSYNDAAWETKQIPGVENTMNAVGKTPEYYQSGVWYRYKFNLPDSIKEKFVKLMFYSVNYVADVWVNGTYAGYHEGGYTPFAFNVSKYLNYGGNNTIAVRVDNPAWGTRTDIVPYYKVDWFNYTGIIHDIYLEVTDPVTVMRADVVPLNTDGDINANVVLYNSGKSDKATEAVFEVFTADVTSFNLSSEYASSLAGEKVAVTGQTSVTLPVYADSCRVWKTRLRIPNPKLWSPAEPNLYIIKVSLYSDGKKIDEYYDQIGIRKVETEGSRLLLNGRTTFLTGVARHEDHPLCGRSVPIDTIFSDLLKVKGLNCNWLRTGHYPNHLYTYLILDRLGIAAEEEIPVWWFDESQPWIIQNNLRHIHQQMFREMVFKDYNRPSLILWSTCNECREENNRKVFIQNINQDLDTNYPDGRLVTQSAAADRPGTGDPTQAACDVAGWTMYFGIFQGTSGQYYSGTLKFLYEAHAANPNKPILNTEFGWWSGENMGNLNGQVTAFNETFRALANPAPITSRGTYNSNGFLMATTWWCIFDWYTSQQPNGYQSMGLYSLDRKTLKPVGTTLKNAYLPYYKLGGSIATDVKEPEKTKTVSSYMLDQNYPNPFNPVTTINYSIPVSGRTELSVYDILGNKVAALVDEYKQAGSYSVKFSASGFPSGIYIYKLKSGNFTNCKKLTLLK